MTNAIFKGRRAVHLENDSLRVTVLEEGGHIAEVFDKRAGVSPLWVPPWTSIEPSTFSPDKHSNFGAGPDAKLLAGIMGHNLCLDSVRRALTRRSCARASRFTAKLRSIAMTSRNLPANCFSRLTLPMAQLKFERIRPTARAVRQNSRSRGKSQRDGPSPCLDAARHAGPSLSRSRDNAVPRLHDPFGRLASGYRLQRLPHSGQRVFMANRSSPGWRAVGPASDAQDRSRQRLYRPSG